jgi:hypothetical protein
MMKLKITLFILVAFTFYKVQAQDPVITQFYLMPEKMNPAFTGISNTWNAGILHRRQWPDGNQYRYILQDRFKLRLAHAFRTRSRLW